MATQAGSQGVQSRKYRLLWPGRKKFQGNLSSPLLPAAWDVVGFSDAPQAELEPIVPVEFLYPLGPLRLFVVWSSDASGR